VALPAEFIPVPEKQEAKPSGMGLVTLKAEAGLNGGMLMFLPKPGLPMTRKTKRRRGINEELVHP
jgi:hypothetical protein